MLYVSAGNIESCSPDKNRIKVICPSTWIHYIVSGKGYYNGNTVTSGQAFIVHKNDFCDYYPDKYDPWTYIWIRLEGEDEEKLLERCGLPCISCVFSFDYGERLLTVSRALLGDGMLCEMSRLYRESTAKTILSLHQKANLESVHTWDERWVVRAKDYIAANYHKRLTVEKVAAAIYVDRQYLRNLFVKYTGISTKAYLDKYRMSRAAELLELNNSSISMIALSVGYSDPFAFSKAFKKHYGASPSEYASANRSK